MKTYDKDEFRRDMHAALEAMDKMMPIAKAHMNDADPCRSECWRMVELGAELYSIIGEAVLVSLDVDINDFMGVYTTNIGWNFLMAREAAKQMKEKGGGAIVFIGSNSSTRVTENRCAYCSSKSAINAMSKSFAVDWGRYGIRSNCVLPSMIKTKRWEENLNNIKYCLPNYTPIEDIASFEDVANAAWYLGSDQSRNTTGAEIVVDGGMLAQLTPNINRELWKD